MYPTPITTTAVGRTHAAAEMAALHGDYDEAERIIAERLRDAPPTEERAALERLRKEVGRQRVSARGQA
jgi:hypothetical protein